MPAHPLNNKNILVAPLDWGLGHATRCIPIIQYLREKGANVLLGGEGRSLQLLKHSFPELLAVDLPAYNIRYAHGNQQLYTLARQIPHLLTTFTAERAALHQIEKTHAVDAVISDNRYGLWSNRIPSVFLTHQISPIAPFRYFVYALQKRYLARFDACWILDEEANGGLSGSLAHAYAPPQHATFIGNLSRFSTPKTSLFPFPLPENIDLTVILSGPEPQRTLLFDAIVKQSSLLPYSIVIVEGKPESEHSYQKGNLTVFPYLTETSLLSLIQRSNALLSRGGYTSIMDFAAIQAQNVVLIPTPGQAEQEYLAHYHAQKAHAFAYTQSNFQLSQVLQELQHLPVRTFPAFTEKWKNTVDVWASRVF